MFCRLGAFRCVCPPLSSVRRVTETGDSGNTANTRTRDPAAIMTTREHESGSSTAALPAVFFKHVRVRALCDTLNAHVESLVPFVATPQFLRRSDLLNGWTDAVQAYCLRNEDTLNQQLQSMGVDETVFRAEHGDIPQLMHSFFRDHTQQVSLRSSALIPFETRVLLPNGTWEERAHLGSTNAMPPPAGLGAMAMPHGPAYATARYFVHDCRKLIYSRRDTNAVVMPLLESEVTGALLDWGKRCDEFLKCVLARSFYGNEQTIGKGVSTAKMVTDLGVPLNPLDLHSEYSIRIQRHRSPQDQLQAAPAAAAAAHDHIRSSTSSSAEHTDDFVHVNIYQLLALFEQCSCWKTQISLSSRDDDDEHGGTGLGSESLDSNEEMTQMHWITLLERLCLTLQRMQRKMDQVDAIRNKYLIRVADAYSSNAALAQLFYPRHASQAEAVDNVSRTLRQIRRWKEYTAATSFTERLGETRDIVHEMNSSVVVVAGEWVGGGGGAGDGDGHNEEREEEWEPLERISSLIIGGQNERVQVFALSSIAGLLHHRVPLLSGTQNTDDDATAAVLLSLPGGESLFPRVLPTTISHGAERDTQNAVWPMTPLHLRVASVFGRSVAEGAVAFQQCLRGELSHSTAANPTTGTASFVNDECETFIEEFDVMPMFFRCWPGLRFFSWWSLQHLSNIEDGVTDFLRDAVAPQVAADCCPNAVAMQFWMLLCDIFPAIQFKSVIRSISPSYGLIPTGLGRDIALSLTPQGLAVMQQPGVPRRPTLVTWLSGDGDDSQSVRGARGPPLQFALPSSLTPTPQDYFSALTDPASQSPLLQFFRAVAFRPSLMQESAQAMAIYHKLERTANEANASASNRGEGNGHKQTASGGGDEAATMLSLLENLRVAEASIYLRMSTNGGHEDSERQRNEGEDEDEEETTATVRTFVPQTVFSTTVEDAIRATLFPSTGVLL